MTQTIQSDNPDVVKKESGEEEVTEQSLIDAFANTLTAPTESEEPEEESDESETDEDSSELTDNGDSTEEEAEDDEEEEAEESDDEDVLSQIDVDALSTEQKIELARLIGSDVGKDNGKLRRENREKEERIAQLEKEIESGLSQVLPKDNQFSEITDVEALEAKAKEINASIAAASHFLRGDEDYITVGDQEIDRKTVGAWLDVYLQQKEDIPKQRARIEELKSAGGISAKELEKVKSELSWFEDTESEAYKSFQTLKKDSDLDLVKRISPKLAARLEGILAHAANSMAGKSSPKKKVLLPRKAKSISGKLGGAASNKPDKGAHKKVSAARSRILSGEVTEDDIITAAFTNIN